MILEETSLEKLRYDPITGDFWWTDKAYHQVVGKLAGSTRSNGYRTIWLDGHCYSAHRLAWYMTYGRWPDHEIDHIDGNKSNNAILNLRDVTRELNCQNTKVKGYRLHRPSGKWQPRIMVKGKSIYLGLCDTPEEARQVYEEAKEKYHVLSGRLKEN